jgi:hypothetical protein
MITCKSVNTILPDALWPDVRSESQAFEHSIPKTLQGTRSKSVHLANLSEFLWRQKLNNNNYEAIASDWNNSFRAFPHIQREGESHKDSKHEYSTQPVKACKPLGKTIPEGFPPVRLSRARP